MTKSLLKNKIMKEEIKENSNKDKLDENIKSEQSTQNLSENKKDSSELKVTPLAYVLHKTWAKKWKILIVFIVSFALSCIWILNVPRYYTCSVELAPEVNSSKGNSSLGNIASSLGFNLGSIDGSDAIYPNIYPDLLASNNFIFDLIKCEVKTSDNKVDTTYYQYLLKHQKKNKLLAPFEGLKKIFDKEKLKEEMGTEEEPKNTFQLSKAQTDVFNDIRSNVSCDIDIKTNLITISVKDQDPLVSATIADSINVRLQKFITDYRTSKAKKDYSYYQKLTAQAKAKYEQARRDYGAFSDANTDVTLESVKSKQEDMENDMQLKFNAYSAMNTQLQAAYAKVLESTPAFTVIKSATVPVKPSGPKRMAFVFICVCLSLIVYLFYINRDLFLGGAK